MQFKRIAIIYNPVGGSASTARVNSLADLFRSAGKSVDLMPTTAEPGSAAVLAEQATSAGSEIVVAFGGDGTACQVAEGLRNKSIPMAVYPGGTGNLFARSFYSAPTPGAFAEMILSGRPQPVDLIRADYQDLDGRDRSRLFMVGFGLGKISDAISEASPVFKRIFGRLVYVVKVGAVCLRPITNRFKLTTHSSDYSEDAAVLFAMNVTPPLMTTLSRGCNASDGLVDIVVFRARTFWQMGSVAFRLAFGKPESSRYYQRLRAASVRIQCDEPVVPNIDGDPGHPTRDITLTVERGAASMILS